MNKININVFNEFDERSKAFFDSKLAERLSQKYGEKPYEERFKLVFYIALIVSYLCNGISILTASSFVFAYIYSILNALPYPVVISIIFTGFILVTIEVLQRVLAPRFFQNWLQYSKKSLLLALLVLSGFSITVSYMGSPDFISIVSNEPVYQEPTLSNIEKTKSDYNTQIAEAKAEAEEYKNRKLWHGRLSDDNAIVYKELLDKVALLREQMNDKVNESEKLNQSLLEQAKTDFETEKVQHEAKIASKGAGLGVVAILAQLFFYLSIWYLEYYDFRVATQYATLLNNRRKKSIDELMFEANMPVNSVITENNSVITDFETELSDIFTIEHKSFKDGSIKRYNMQQLNGIIGTYQKRLNEAKSGGDKLKILSKEESLKYWGGLRKQLAHKITVFSENLP